MNSIETQVMASVRVIHTARLLTSRFAIASYALVASVWTLGTLVWVSRIEENFLKALSGGVGSLARYLVAAFTDTTLPVQVVSLVAVAAVIAITMEMGKAIVSPQRAPAF